MPKTFVTALVYEYTNNDDIREAMAHALRVASDDIEIERIDPEPIKQRIKKLEDALKNGRPVIVDAPYAMRLALNEEFKKYPYYVSFPPRGDKKEFSVERVSYQPRSFDGKIEPVTTHIWPPPPKKEMPKNSEERKGYWWEELDNK